MDGLRGRAALMTARPALAGPPLLCFPFDIGAARSLPIGHGSWRAIDPRYDVSHLADDTLALLAPQTPVLVRMETLRRATLYAADRPEVATALLARLRDRAKVPPPTSGSRCSTSGISSRRSGRPNRSSRNGLPPSTASTGISPLCGSKREFCTRFPPLPCTTHRAA